MRFAQRHLRARAQISQRILAYHVQVLHRFRVCTAAEDYRIGEALAHCAQWHRLASGARWRLLTCWAGRLLFACRAQRRLLGIWLRRF